VSLYILRFFVIINLIVSSSEIHCLERLSEIVSSRLFTRLCEHLQEVNNFRDAGVCDVNV